MPRKTSNKIRLGVELLEDRLVQSTFSTMSLTASPSLSTVTATEATFSPSITAVEITANDLAPVPLVPPMVADANALTPIEGYQPLLEIADPEAQFMASSGGIHIRALSASERLAQGTAAIQARMAEPKAAEVFGTPINNAYAINYGQGVRRDFSNGSMFWSEKTGAHFMSKDIMGRYNRGDLANFYPTEDTKQLAGWQPGSPRGAAAATWNNLFSAATKETLTVVSSPGNVSIIRGDIRAKWLAFGAGRFGVPLNDGFAEYGGTIQTFWFRGLTRGAIPAFTEYQQDRDLAAITWHKETGTHVVIEDGRGLGSYTPWSLAGRASAYITGAWGFPTSDEYVVDANGRGQRNEVVHFMNPNRGGATMAHVSQENPWGLVIFKQREITARNTIVYGDIYQEWTRRGIQVIGLPQHNELDGPTHRLQRFRLMKDGVFLENRYIDMEWDKATRVITVSSWVKTVEGYFVRENYSTTSSAMTVEEPLFTSDPSALGQVSHRLPVIADGDSASTNSSFIDAWSAELAANVGMSATLFGEQYNGVTLGTATIFEDGPNLASLIEESNQEPAPFGPQEPIRFGPQEPIFEMYTLMSVATDDDESTGLAMEETSSDDASDTETLEQSVSAEAIEEVFAEEFVGSEEVEAIDEELS